MKKQQQPPKNFPALLLRRCVTGIVGACGSRLIRHQLVSRLPIVFFWGLLIQGCEDTGTVPQQVRDRTYKYQLIRVTRMEETNKLSTLEDGSSIVFSSVYNSTVQICHCPPSLSKLSKS